MNTLEIENRKKEIEDKKIKSLQKLDLEILGTELTGLKCSAIDENWLTFDASDKGGIKKILKAFKPSKNNAFLKFAGKDPVFTDSPFLLCISNYKHVTNDKYIKGVLKYETSNGLNIWINIDKNVLSFNCIYKKVDENSKAKNPETYAFFTLDNKTGLNVQSYFGGSLTYHGSKERFLELFN